MTDGTVIADSRAYSEQALVDNEHYLKAKKNLIICSAQSYDYCNAKSLNNLY